MNRLTDLTTCSVDWAVKLLNKQKVNKVEKICTCKGC